MNRASGSHQMSSVDVARCLSCGCVDSQALTAVEDTLTRDIYGERLASPVINRLVRCSDCTLVRLHPRLSDESLERIYTDWYSEGYVDSQAAQQNDSARVEEFRDGHLKRLSRIAKPPGKLLDIGTGSGVFLRVANEIGWRVSGLDFSEKAARLAKINHDMNVYVGTLKNLPKDERYDVITMFDYLEHTSTPSEDVAIAYNHLNPGGHLVIRVPNYGSWQSRIMGNAWVGIISLHLSYFEVSSLHRLLSSTGYSIVWQDCGNYQSLFLLLARKLSWIRHKGSIRTPKRSDESRSATPSFLLRTLRFAMASLYEIVDHVGGWFGKSNYIFIIAKKTCTEPVAPNDAA